MELGERLRCWRNKKKVSVYKLYRISDISENHIRSIEKGEKQPTVAKLKALTDALNVSLSEFFNDDEEHIYYLTDKEKHLIDLYRSLPPDKADILADFYAKMNEE
ncbi:MAG: helix-turn-helix domain-containing protein [Prevotella sp.]|nr:helix-turn-helix domain-containing protein [Prevotella sp.]